MQEASRTQQERTELTRAALLDAGRRLFVEKGYAATSTPELVAATGLSRGALYHHYADKQALFAAVVEREAAAVSAEIEAVTGDTMTMLLAGARTYLEAMSVPGRTRLLLIEGPAALGQPAMDALEGRFGNAALRDGLEAAMEDGKLRALPLQPLTELLAGMFDRAALAVARDENEAENCLAVIEAVLNGLRA